MRTRLLVVLAALMLPGCASMSDSYWVKVREPAALISVVRVPSIAGYCPADAAACAQVFESNVCNVYLSAEPGLDLRTTGYDPGFKRTDELEHELCHCLGYDHPSWDTHRGSSATCPVDVRTAKRLIQHTNVARAR